MPCDWHTMPCAKCGRSVCTWLCLHAQLCEGSQ
jgi:hypothetical protein